MSFTELFCTQHIFSYSEVFCDSQKNILRENDIVRFPKLADTYQRIAEEGPNVFYDGSMAQRLVDDIQASGFVHLLSITNAKKKVHVQNIITINYNQLKPLSMI